ncbi:MAG TPA: tail-specific protease, partial [Chitinophagaceae bacterium]|nr:tail-specific protease [Chitinophagaceae bacterium]
MKRLPLVLLMLAAGVFVTFRVMGTSNPEPPTRYERILQSVGEMLQQGHFHPKPFDDKFSKVVFEKYLEELDANKYMFRQEDINALRKYDTKLDDELKGGSVEFFLAAGKLFNQRVEELKPVINDVLSKPFDFSVDEAILV